MRKSGSGYNRSQRHGTEKPSTGKRHHKENPPGPVPPCSIHTIGTPKATEITNRHHRCSMSPQNVTPIIPATEVFTATMSPGHRAAIGPSTCRNCTSSGSFTPDWSRMRFKLRRVAAITSKDRGQDLRASAAAKEPQRSHDPPITGIVDQYAFEDIGKKLPTALGYRVKRRNHGAPSCRFTRPAFGHVPEHRLRRTGIMFDVRTDASAGYVFAHHQKFTLSITCSEYGSRSLSLRRRGR